MNRFLLKPPHAERYTGRLPELRPIISIKGSQMKAYDVNKMMSQLKKAQKAMAKTGNIDVNQQGFTNEEYAEKEKQENNRAMIKTDGKEKVIELFSFR